MKFHSAFLVLCALILQSCGSYNPLQITEFAPSKLPPAEGLTVKFFGNSTFLISDDQTNLLIDGFVSRPSSLKTLFGKISPNPEEIDSFLFGEGILSRGKLAAVLVGHTHFDHALDAPYICKKTGAFAMGSNSYRFVHQGEGASIEQNQFLSVPRSGGSNKFGKFTVEFVPSDHVTAHLRQQKKLEGEIKAPLSTPARYSEFKCGDVFAIHISHPEGNILVTTTAGAKSGEMRKRGLKADVVFLGIGFLSRETEFLKKKYWDENVSSVHPQMIVPIHWDNFSKKLSKGLRPPPKFIDDTEVAMNFVKSRACEQGIKVRVLNIADSVVVQKNRAPISYQGLR